MASMKCIMWMLVVFNCILFITGGAVLGIGIWTAVDKIFISAIVGSDLYDYASYLLIATGGTILLIAFLGFVTTVKKNKCFTLVYFGSLLLVFMLLVIAAVLAVVFKGEIEGRMKMFMRETLRSKYGYLTSTSAENAAITDAWDQTQRKFECCAVDQGSDWNYLLYKDSNWFRNSRDIAFEEKYVPVSCCYLVDTASGEKPLDQNRCQTNKLGPPKNDLSWGENDSLNTKGCYQRGYEFVVEQAGILLAVGFAFSACLVLGMIFAILLYRNIPDIPPPADL